MATDLTRAAIRIFEFTPTRNVQFRGAEPAELLSAAGAWLATHPDASVVALNLTNFDLLENDPQGGFLLDLVVDQGAHRIDQ